MYVRAKHIDMNSTFPAFVNILCVNNDKSNTYSYRDQCLPNPNI